MFTCLYVFLCEFVSLCVHVCVRVCLCMLTSTVLVSSVIIIPTSQSRSPRATLELSIQIKPHASHIVDALSMLWLCCVDGAKVDAREHRRKSDH
jgi:hypothetical protein